jgi:hypothetical protein
MKEQRAARAARPPLAGGCRRLSVCFFIKTLITRPRLDLGQARPPYGNTGVTEERTENILPFNRYRFAGATEGVTDALTGGGRA